MNEPRIDQFKHQMNERHDLMNQRNAVYSAMNDFATYAGNSLEEVNTLIVRIVREMETFINIKLDQLK